jgi:ABC-type polysaccharide/polyol phosphate export permease
VPYPLFAYCGLVAWNFTASALKFSTTSLTSNPNMVTKVYFPREIFPFSAVFVSLVDFAVASLVLAAFMAYYGVAPSATALLLPLVLIVHVAFTAGIALLVAMGNLFYRDVKYLFEIFLVIWMFATSVLYPVDKVGGWAGLVLANNPMTPIIDGYRNVLLLDATPFSPAFAGSAFLAFSILIAGWVAFHRAELQFAENI